MPTTTAPEDTFTRPEDAASFVADQALEAFLQDPIGYGNYDFADPITLAEFSASPRSRSAYVSIIA